MWSKISRIRTPQDSEGVKYTHTHISHHTSHATQGSAPGYGEVRFGLSDMCSHVVTFMSNMHSA